MKAMLHQRPFDIRPASFAPRLPFVTKMRALLLTILILAAAAVALLAYVAHVSRHKKSSKRMPALVGSVAVVERALAPEGFVLVDGELWRARLRGGAGVAREGESVRVVGASGYVLEVEREA
jgi:membrane-bound serine protease (ClpP class)